MSLFSSMILSRGGLASCAWRPFGSGQAHSWSPLGPVYFFELDFGSPHLRLPDVVSHVLIGFLSHEFVF